MKARDLMISPVITIGLTATVRDVAKLLVEKQISSLPVVDGSGKPAGIVTEGDLLRRVEAGTENHYSWWVHMLAGNHTVAGDYVKSHSVKIQDIMSRDVITAAPDTEVYEIAGLLEENHIKRVPIVDTEGTLVGIVSRSNIVQLVAGARPEIEVTLTDETIRDALMGKLKTLPWAHPHHLNITVSNGIVDIWGGVESDEERNAIRVAAELHPGVTLVNDHLLEMPVFGT
ncbi:CBS domain-containing protein [Tardiphaga sp. P9-11]|uniref:CBS domain-containing protein n=1 Tax=Tardiphaga sp. P9-11 TaxID=2024614 RepID=UPI0011F38F54|nr:CBS domain-containing protein [Tardiphaga sp. P9-11]KAA0074151.1 CBS domain-containing protein [Tardiphaga sp. P9-11]